MPQGNPTFIGGITRGVQTERAEFRQERGLRLQEGALDNATERLRQQDEERQEKLKREKLKDRANFAKESWDISYKLKDLAGMNKAKNDYFAVGEEFGFKSSFKEIESMEEAKEFDNSLKVYSKKLEDVTTSKQAYGLLYDWNSRFPSADFDVDRKDREEMTERAVKKMKRQSGIARGDFTEKEVARKEFGLPAVKGEGAGIGDVSVKDVTPESLQKFSESGNYADLVLRKGKGDDKSFKRARDTIQDIIKNSKSISGLDMQLMMDDFDAWLAKSELGGSVPPIEIAEKWLKGRPAHKRRWDAAWKTINKEFGADDISSIEGEPSLHSSETDELGGVSARGLEGRTGTDTETGIKYRSNGATWEPIS